MGFLGFPLKRSRNWSKSDAFRVLVAISIDEDGLKRLLRLVNWEIS